MYQLEQFLSQLNFSEKESALYLASLKYGPQTASVLSKKTGISRSTVNFVFNDLIKKGFATKEERTNTTYFSTITPDSLGFVIKEKADQCKKMFTEFKELLPLFNSLQNKLSSIPKIRYFEGVEGLCRMLDDFCTTDQTVLYISGHNMMHPKIREYTYKVYLPISNTHKNKNKIILNEGPKSREYQKIAKKAYDEFIFADPQKYPFTLTTAIYGNKVAFWSYDPSDMTGVIIENQLISDNMKTVFSMLKTFLGTL